MVEGTDEIDNWPVQLLRCLCRRGPVVTRPTSNRGPSVGEPCRDSLSVGDGRAAAPPGNLGTLCDCCGTYQGTGQQFIRYSLVTDTGYSTVGGEQCSIEAETPLIVCKGCDLSRFNAWLIACPLKSMAPEQPAGPPDD